MEKLIELLKLKDGYEDISYGEQSDRAYMFWLDGMAYREERLLSKKFGFIQWLVDNDKITIPTLVGRFDGYESVLCWLAISNEPIKCLIEMLK